MKTKLIIAFSAFFLITLLGPQELRAQKTKYYVVCGWLKMYNKPGENRPFVTNVVQVSCKYHDSTMVINQLDDFFLAFVKKKSGFDYISDNVAFFEDTYDKAEKKRRELIADYNDGYILNGRRIEQDAYLIHNFSVLCDD